MYHLKPAKFTNRFKIYLFVALTVIGLAVMTILEVTDTTYIFHDRKTPISASAETKGETQSASVSKGNVTESPDKDTAPNPAINNNKQASDSSAQDTLLAPSGNFVSNHQPNLDGSPAPNMIHSVCTTTAGASCLISFTQGSVTKTLVAQTTDRGGSAFWSWKLQDIGLTTGTWQVEAKVTLQGSSKTTSDALPLEVSP